MGIASSVVTCKNNDIATMLYTLAYITMCLTTGCVYIVHVQDSVDGSLTGVPEVSVIEFDIPYPVVSPWADDINVTLKTKRKGMYIDNSPVEGSNSSYASDKNIIAPPES